MQSRHIHHGLMGRGSYSRSCRGRPMEEGLYRCNMKLAVTATSSTSPRAAVFHLTTVCPCRLQLQLTGNREGFKLFSLVRLCGTVSVRVRVRVFVPRALRHMRGGHSVLRQ